MYFPDNLLTVKLMSLQLFSSQFQPQHVFSICHISSEVLRQWFQLFIVRKHLFLKSPLAPLFQRGDVGGIALCQREEWGDCLCQRGIIRI